MPLVLCSELSNPGFLFLVTPTQDREGTLKNVGCKESAIDAGEQNV